MPKAVWRGVVIAESDHVETVEGNAYFPPEALRAEYFSPSPTRTICGWKGTAHYHTVTVDGASNPDAAWYYPDPKPAAANIANHVAFWKGVRVED